MSRARPHRSPPPSPPRAAAHLLPVATLALLAAVLYLPGLDGPFVYDDPNAITQSTLIRRLTPLRDFVVFSTRPLTDFSFAVNYAIGQLNPRAYHATNGLLHVVNTLLLYAIAWRTLGLPALARYAPGRRAVAWAGAGLFAAHPLASEAVAYASSRSEILAATFYLLALGTFTVAATTTRRRPRIAAAALLPVWAAAGLASKEIAATLPAALLLYDWCFLAAGRWRRTRLRWWLVGLAALPLAGGGAFLLYRAYTTSTGLGDYGATAGLGFDRFGRWEYLCTQFGVVAYYLRLVVLPVGLTFDYDWPLARSPWAPGVVLPFLLLAGLAVLAWRCVRTQPLVTFAAFFTLLVLAPTSSVLPIADLAVERRMYLPLAALMWLAAAGLWDLAGRLGSAWPAARRRPAAAYGALVGLPLAAFVVLTAQRAALWADPIALHEDGVAKAPGNPRVRLNLGVTYLNLGQRDAAYEALLEAKAVFDRGESLHAFRRIGAFIHYNLGAVLYVRGEADRAEPELERAIELGGEYLALRPMAYMLLGRIAAGREDWAEAAAYLAEAVRYQDNPDWRVDLAQAQALTGDHTAARATLRDTVIRYPDHARAKELLEVLR